MLEKLDKLFYRFEEAYRSFVDPSQTHRAYNDGKEVGKLIGYSQVRRQLDTYDPYQFENQHFKLGYYYAYEKAKEVMKDDEDNSVD